MIVPQIPLNGVSILVLMAVLIVYLVTHLQWNLYITTS